ncbi:hypothetical protein [Lysobacter sp. yr284]|uniref:hypothetical protein n=1 Tax=Lysobacter sp. yr284 TaxID=1761791 RepID=UPI001113B6E9|nr:hypothetical protein [Lysobacter sp. yr284]
MAEPLPPQLRSLVDEFAKQKDLPSNAAQDVEAAIASSPYLASVMVDAVDRHNRSFIDQKTE